MLNVNSRRKLLQNGIIHYYTLVFKWISTNDSDKIKLEN